VPGNMARREGGNGDSRGLADAGIRLRNERPGEHRAACPECAKAKPRRGDDALAVKVEPDGGATWLCHRCGWRSSTRSPAATQELRQRAPAPEPERPVASFSGAPESLWRSCRTITENDPAGSYLTKRGCALPHPDGDLRWHPKLQHSTGYTGPALVALVTDAVTVEPLTLHRTWIQEDGTKAPVDRPRLLWPGLPKAGGVVRLWPDEEVTLGLCVAEGTETALTAARGFQPVWSTSDARNLETLPVLAGLDALTIIADHDQAGLDAAQKCAQRWVEAGVEVKVWKAPAEGDDLNDFVRAVA
jgi:putative DNA primase/helicase